MPERAYDLAGGLLARAIETSVADGTPVLDALNNAAATYGAKLGKQARAAADTMAGPDAPRDAACQVLAASGYEPHLHDDAVLLRNCPFHVLAREHTALVCGMNLALIQAVTDRLGDSLTPRLDSGDGRCCALVDTS